MVRFDPLFQVSQGGLVAYVVPNFNQECTLIFGTYDGEQQPYLNTVCQVRGVTRFTGLPITFTASEGDDCVLIALPKGTPVYGSIQDATDCLVQVVDNDANTLYQVMIVWDVAQGFSNEYRMCACRRRSPLHGQ